MLLNLGISLYFLSMSVLFIYTFAYLMAALSILLKKKSQLVVDKNLTEPVAILVPSFNEGRALVETIKSLLLQDYLGPIKIYILLKDETDSSYQYLATFLQEQLPSELRTVEIILSGHREKKVNINRQLPKITEPYIAFLDADHRADSNWISLSVSCIQKNNLNAVQSVRRPLALTSFFQVWDSLQNHIGNEVFNNLYQKINLNTFFTGTTCVFTNETLKNRLFPDSLTEDTALSYQLILEGKKIGYNGESGSYEEVAPNITSYISRRRRWSQGHSQTFITNFISILKSRLNFRQKAQLLLHGAYYLIPLLILLGSNIVGLFYFFQYTTDIKLIVISLTSLWALMVALVRYKMFKDSLIEFFLGFINFFPFVALGSILFYKFYQQEEYYYIVSFPYLKYLIWLTSLMMISPMLVFIVGKRFVKKPTLLILFSHILFYPMVLLIDIFSIGLGLCDLLRNNKSWGQVTRSNQVDSQLVPKQIFNNAENKTGHRPKWYVAIFFPIMIIGLIFINDFFIFHNCGEVNYLFGDYIFFERQPPLISKLELKQTAYDRANYHLKIYNKLQNPKNMTGEIKILLDGKILYQDSIAKKEILLNEYAPLGWQTHEIQTEIKTDSFTCVQQKKFSSSVKELREHKLYLNGEPFLIKCIIPSFRFATSNLELSTGLAQIKDAGANCVRLYHTPTQEFLAAAKKNELLIISQPDETTWENIEIYLEHNIKKIISRYEKHLKKTQGHPYILFDHLGNELELNEYFEESLKNVKKSLKQIKNDSTYRNPLSYATYSTYINYPVDILGINMLDSGDVYWNDALMHTRSLKLPFYASEFGGFVAFHENTPTFIRIARLFKDWNQLLALGANGAAFFQSHDNWSQPIPFGVNDPFNNEHPDDNRGFWSVDNKAKPELEALKLIFSDLDFKWKNQHTLEITNRREYKISNLKLSLGETLHSVAELMPGQSWPLQIPYVQDLSVKYQFESHHSLRSSLQFIFKAKQGMQLETLNSSIALEVKQLHDNQWGDFKENNKDGGLVILKVILPKSINNMSYLVFDGLGSDLIKITNTVNGRFMFLTVHNYREQFFQLKKIFEEIGEAQVLMIEIQRDQIEYLNEQAGQQILIPLKKPYLIIELSDS